METMRILCPNYLQDQRRVYRAIASVAIFALHLSSHAQDTASVLPKNIFRVRAVQIFGMDLTKTFNNNGDRNMLLSKLNTTLSAESQAQRNAELNSLYQKLNAVEDRLGDKLFQTDLSADGSMKFKQSTLAVEYGLSDQVSLGMILPIVSFKIDPNASITTQSQAENIARKLDNMGPTFEQLAAGVRRFESQKLSSADYEKALYLDNGYQVPGRTQATGIGDLEVGAKWRLYHRARTQISATGGVRLPTTSHRADPRNLLDRSTGDKQIDYQIAAVATIEPIPNLAFSMNSKYTLQFADTRARHVPSFGQIGLTNLNDENNKDNVRRNLGDIYESEVSSTAYFNKRSLFTYGLYNMMLKGADKYSGSKNLDYAALGANTQQAAHKFELGMGYSTLPAFRAKKAALPLEIKIAFNDTFRGKNVSDSAYTRLDLYLYF